MLSPRLSKWVTMACLTTWLVGGGGWVVAVAGIQYNSCSEAWEIVPNMVSQPQGSVKPLGLVDYNSSDLPALGASHSPEPGRVIYLCAIHL